MNRRFSWPLCGLAFGCVLFVFAFGSAAGGHGSYLPFMMFGAPASLVPVLGLFAAPAWWAGIGWRLQQGKLSSTMLAMTLHIVTVVAVLWLGSPMEPGAEQWRYFRDVRAVMPQWLWSGFVVYIIGQATVWCLIAREVIRHRAEIAHLAAPQ
jgi:hypothetical protein